MDDCLNLAMECNPGLQASQKRIDISEARIGTSVDIPNTGIELSQNAIEGPSIDNGITFSQEFDFPTVYVAKRKVLKAEAKVSREEYNEANSALRGEVFSLYYSILYEETRLGLLKKEKESYDEFSRISHIRFEDGETSRLEYLNADRMKAKMASEIETAEFSISRLKIRLGSIMGYDSDFDIKPEELPILEFGDGILAFDAAATHSSRVMNAKIEMNEKNVWLKRQEFMPGLSVSATSQLFLKGFNPYHIERSRFEKGDFMGFSVGITVPLFFGSKRSQLIAARKETELARLQLDDELQRQSAEFKNLTNELAFAGKRLEYYNKEALDRANEMRRLSQVSYELGEIDYMEHMQNIQAALEIELEYLETIEKYNQSIIKIQTLKGEI